VDFWSHAGYYCSISRQGSAGNQVFALKDFSTGEILDSSTLRPPAIAPGNAWFNMSLTITGSNTGSNVVCTLGNPAETPPLVGPGQAGSEASFQVGGAKGPAMFSDIEVSVPGSGGGGGNTPSPSAPVPTNRAEGGGGNPAGGASPGPASSGAAVASRGGPGEVGPRAQPAYAGPESIYATAGHALQPAIFDTGALPPIASLTPSSGLSFGNGLNIGIELLIVDLLAVGGVFWYRRRWKYVR
jgi:hypothetical protein